MKTEDIKRASKKAIQKSIAVIEQIKIDDPAKYKALQTLENADRFVPLKGKMEKKRGRPKKEG